MNLTESRRAVLMDKLLVHISVNKYDIPCKGSTGENNLSLMIVTIFSKNIGATIIE